MCGGRDVFVFVGVCVCEWVFVNVGVCVCEWVSVRGEEPLGDHEGRGRGSSDSVLLHPSDSALLHPTSRGVVVVVCGLSACERFCSVGPTDLTYTCILHTRA